MELFRKFLLVAASVLLSTSVFAQVNVLNGKGPDLNKVGTLKRNHTITLDFEGENPYANGLNPFLDYLMIVFFYHIPSGASQWTWGYYAGNGNAANTDGQVGNRWEAKFRPELTGTHYYQVLFFRGAGVAVPDFTKSPPFPTTGQYIGPDKESGFFDVVEVETTDPPGRYLGPARLKKNYAYRAYGRETLPERTHHLNGIGSSELILNHVCFKNTPIGKHPRHTFVSHATDAKTSFPHWESSDPMCGSNGIASKGLAGLPQYLADRKINGIYLLLMNVNGDGNDIWPWTGNNSTNLDLLDMDVGKLAQWEIFFEHLDDLGFLLNLYFQEMENWDYLNNGSLGLERRLLYKEIVARFAHHNSINWDLGEENENSIANMKANAEFLFNIDPYKRFGGNLIKVHNTWGYEGGVAPYDIFLPPFLGENYFAGPDYQFAHTWDIFSFIAKYREHAKQAGVSWASDVVEMHSPLSQNGLPAPPDSSASEEEVDAYEKDIRFFRQYGTMGSRVAGASGYMSYLGNNPGTDCLSDLSCEDLRVHEDFIEMMAYSWELWDGLADLGVSTEALSDLSYLNDSSSLGQGHNWTLHATKSDNYGLYLFYYYGSKTGTINLPVGTYQVYHGDTVNGGGWILGDIISGGNSVDPMPSGLPVGKERVMLVKRI